MGIAKLPGELLAGWVPGRQAGDAFRSLDTVRCKLLRHVFRAPASLTLVSRLVFLVALLPLGLFFVREPAFDSARKLC